MPEHTGFERPGGRTAQTRTAVHDAVRLLQREDADLTIPAVAAASGVHATTIYRRWRTIESLVLDVAVEDISALAPVPHTGDLERDLSQYVPRLLAGIRRSGSFRFFALVLSAQQANERGVVADLVQPRLDQFQAMLDAADVTAIDAMGLVELVHAPAYFWAQLGRPLHPKRDSDRLVRNALRAARDADGTAS